MKKHRLFIRSLLIISLATLSFQVSANEVGKSIYDKYCHICHNTGVANSPKLGDKEAWAPRIAKGEEELLKVVITGTTTGLPPKGMCMECDDEMLLETIRYMISTTE